MEVILFQKLTPTYESLHSPLADLRFSAGFGSTIFGRRRNFALRNLLGRGSARIERRGRRVGPLR